jgi:hypothetical protein
MDEPVNEVVTQMLEDLSALDGLEFGEGRKRCAFDKIASHRQLELLVKADRIHPEAFALSRYNFELFGTINYGPIRYRQDSPQSEKIRDELLRQLMGRVRIALNLRGRDFWWVSSTEYGYENRVHGHFLIGLKTKVVTEFLSILFNRSLGDLTQVNGDPLIGTLHLEPITNSMGAVAYLCKEEFQRPMKHFIYSSSILAH